jgi:hypothetical protein
MSGRQDRIYEETAALWRELFGEPPPIKTDGAMMLDVILRALPERPYDRIASPHLRPSQISRPKSGHRST